MTYFFIGLRQLINLYKSQKTNNIHYLRFSFIKYIYIYYHIENIYNFIE